MRLRDVVPIWRLERLWQQLQRREEVSTIPIQQHTDYEELLREISKLPPNWHGAGACGSLPLRAMATHGQARTIARSAETGVGKSTLLFSHLSKHHTVFALDDTGGTNSLGQVRASPLLNQASVEFVLGPTQETLPRYRFVEQLQLVLIDGPHGYPFPDLEYYFFYPHLDENALLIIDDIHIPTIFRLFSFLREDAMFDFLGVASTTAFFRRNSVPLFNPTGDGWWLQNYNRSRFPIKSRDNDFREPNTPVSKDFKQLMREASR
jgi:hypothetical protein